MAFRNEDTGLGVRVDFRVSRLPDCLRGKNLRVCSHMLTSVVSRMWTRIDVMHVSASMHVVQDAFM